MNKKFIWLSALVLGLVFGQATNACPTDKNQSTHCHCNANKKMSSTLNLTDEQKVKIKAIKVQTHNSLKNNYKQLKALRLEINALSSSDTLDEAKLDKLINERNTIKGNILKSHVLMQHQIYLILTDKQKAEYKELHKQ